MPARLTQSLIFYYQTQTQTNLSSFPSHTQTDHFFTDSDTDQPVQITLSHTHHFFTKQACNILELTERTAIGIIRKMLWHDLLLLQ